MSEINWGFIGIIISTLGIAIAIVIGYWQLKIKNENNKIHSQKAKTLKGDVVQTGDQSKVIIDRSTHITTVNEKKSPRKDANKMKSTDQEKKDRFTEKYNELLKKKISDVDKSVAVVGGKLDMMDKIIEIDKTAKEQKIKNGNNLKNIEKLKKKLIMYLEIGFGNIWNCNPNTYSYSNHPDHTMILQYFHLINGYKDEIDPEIKDLYNSALSRLFSFPIYTNMEEVFNSYHEIKKYSRNKVLEIKNKIITTTEKPIIIEKETSVNPREYFIQPLGELNKDEYIRGFFNEPNQKKFSYYFLNNANIKEFLKERKTIPFIFHGTDRDSYDTKKRKIKYRSEYYFLFKHKASSKPRNINFRIEFGKEELFG